MNWIPDREQQAWTTTRSAATESVYVVTGEVSGDAITRSLQALMPTRHHPTPAPLHRAGYVRRARQTRRRVSDASGENGASAVAWQPHGGGSQLAIRLKQPVSFAWDFPDGPLQQRLASVIGARRLLAQADARSTGRCSRFSMIADKTVGRLRIVSGQARLPMSTQRGDRCPPWSP